MPLATAATGIGIGKQVVTHAVRTWLGARRERAERDAELIDLVRISVRDHFQRRKLVRQLEDLADEIAERLRPVYEHDFRQVAENERVAALLAVVDALEAADLTDATLFAVDVDARRLARLVRERVPVTRVGLAEPAERFYDAVLDESCMALVQVVRHLPAFEPRALAELLFVDAIADELNDRPRQTLGCKSQPKFSTNSWSRLVVHPPLDTKPKPPLPNNSGYLRRREKTMMINSAAPVRDDRCLVPVSARFALSQAGLPISVEFPSGAETRPFALRFVRPPNRAMNDSLPPYRYCPVRQVLVSDDDDDDEPVVWEPTTVGSKDGKENPQEDWKPDLPFHAES